MTGHLLLWRFIDDNLKSEAAQFPNAPFVPNDPAVAEAFPHAFNGPGTKDRADV